MFPVVPDVRYIGKLDAGVIEENVTSAKSTGLNPNYVEYYLL